MNETSQDFVLKIVALAESAGERIMEIYEGSAWVKEKEDRSPLTEADLASHELISAGLKRLTPRLPVLSEESSEIPWNERSAWQRYWLIDPLDGTKEFLKRNGEFTVNIALIENGRPIVGVVHVPATGVTYFASSAIGAFKRDSDAVSLPLRTKAYNPKSPLKVVGSRSHVSESFARFLDQMGKRIPGHELVSMGSSLKFCLVAEGVADFYPRLGPTSEWDTAAAHCIVEEAGGMVVDSAFLPLKYNRKQSLLNSDFFVLGDRDGNWKHLLGFELYE